MEVEDWRFENLRLMIDWWTCRGGSADLCVAEDLSGRRWVWLLAWGYDDGWPRL